jgi:hypothetical protein
MAAAPPPLFPFVFVGCWNQPGEDGAAPPPRNHVAAAIATMSDIQFIVLGGDNVYPKPSKPNPNGSKAKKKHEFTVFEEGMELYKRIGKPIIPAFGNHNVELIDKEMEYFNVSKTYNRYDFADNVHILALDTNIIIDKEKSGVKYDEMLEWFRVQVSSLPDGHRYFVVQHDPYFTARSKGTGELINAGPFLDVQFSNPPIAILCADTHHYQHATIESNAHPDVALHQFIVGTGGAHRDKHLPDFTTHEFQKKYKFTQISAIEGFGFLRVAAPDLAAFEFIKVMDWIGEGGRRKSRKSQRQRRQRRQSQRSQQSRRSSTRRSKNAT